MSNKKTLPTPNTRRSAHNTPVLVSGSTARGADQECLPSQLQAHPAGTRAWPSAAENSPTSSGLTTCSRKSAQAAFTGPPDSSAAAFTPAARKPRRQLPLHPTIRPFTGNNLGSQPSAGAPGGAPKGEAQGIPKKLEAFSGAGGRQISRTNANALAAKGNAGEDHCAGGVIRIGGNPHPGNARRGLVAQPVGEGGELGGGVEALEQFGGGLGRERTSGAADEQAVRRLGQGVGDAIGCGEAT